MPVEEITVPQMGEGLQEVRILKFLKEPNGRVEVDEPIYEIETDKATMEVESPVQGTLLEWAAKEGDILPVGKCVARIETGAAGSPAVASQTKLGERTAPAVAAQHPARSAGVPAAESRSSPTSDVIIPPRTRAHARALGLSEEDLRKIPTSTGKLMPEDVDRHVASLREAGHAKAPVKTAGPGTPFTDIPLPPQQKVLNFRLKRSAQTVIPCSCTRTVDWGRFRKSVEALSRNYPNVRITEFRAFAYCVVQATKEHPKFRSALIGEETIRQYDHLNLGIAVERGGDELVTAVVTHADTLDLPALVEAAREQIHKARDGEDQAVATVQLYLTYMGKFEIIDATPVLVAPAVGVLFIGTPYSQGDRLLANLALTFDHRLINGVGASHFLNAIAQQVDNVGSLSQGADSEK